jgi:membrane-associated protein
MPDIFAEIARALIAAVATHQYVTLFLAIAVEEAGIPLPVPGDLLIAYYGWRAGGDPVEVARVILVCAAASTVGTQTPYWLARRFGRRIAAWAAYWLDIDERSMERVFGWLEGHGFRAVLLARLIPGLRVVVSLVAGTARVPPQRFTAGVFVGGVVYWTGWVLLGAVVGPHLADVVSPAYLELIVILVPVLYVFALTTRVLIAMRRRRERSTPRATSGGTRGGQA